MSSFTTVDRTTTPPTLSIPRTYNAVADFIDRNLAEGRGEKTAVVDAGGAHSYADLAGRVNRAGNALAAFGLTMEQRVLLCLLDGIDFPALFFGAIKAGIVPVPVNTMLTTSDYDFMLRDSRARVLVVSAPLYERFEPILADQPFLEHVVVAGGEGGGRPRLDALLDGAGDTLAPAPTTTDDAAFWLYTSGSTGTPKGAVHIQSAMVNTAELYGRAVLGIREDDVVFSAAKLFFAYGLGNAMTFPFWVGATAVLMAERPTPEAVFRMLRAHRPSIFYGVPTLYAGLLQADDLPTADEIGLRHCVSAGEALPEGIARRWRERVGVDILDGLGSTEMLHIFLSNAPGDVRYASSGRPVPGYELRVVDGSGHAAATGAIGDLLVSGPSSAVSYWNNRARSLESFRGRWTRTGDKYAVDAKGYYIYAGRSDDMLKVGGIFVSPFEVEAALITHDAVLEAAVVGHEDQNRLVKPKAFVVLKEGVDANEALAGALQAHVKDRLAPYKYPRWIEFTDALPKTATGKIQRFKLRAG